MKYEISITPFWKIVVHGSDDYHLGERILFKTKDGIDTGTICAQAVEEESIGEILRPVNDEDLAKLEELKEYAEWCLFEFKNAIRAFNMDMKAVYAHCQFDAERVIFYFTAEHKMKFRKLHRFISQQLNKRVVIKQIGARDFARYCGGMGPCGRKVCCAAFLKDLKSISLRMARRQNIFLTPNKLSGICGKLLCCLNFEEDFYTDFRPVAIDQKTNGVANGENTQPEIEDL
ncbi:MAG: regulatory iron-sulfur-containing complex subunit RicT [candidate division WOR-3 bacterium]